MNSKSYEPNEVGCTEIDEALAVDEKYPCLINRFYQEPLKKGYKNLYKMLQHDITMFIVMANTNFVQKNVINYPGICYSCTKAMLVKDFSDNSEYISVCSFVFGLPHLE